jgi:hypothetical protein
MTGNAVRLHRVLRAPVERVYRAFVEPAALAKWLPPHGYTCSVSCGTNLQIAQEGIPEAIPVEQCYVGWQQSLQLLALLVEADEPGS